MKADPVKNLTLFSKTLLAVFLLVINTTGYAENIEFSSKQNSTHLIELYTSEGCYSCPPADRWLSNLNNNSELFIEFVPVAFHVDYWNYLGWLDKYSKGEYSNRQRRYHSLGQVSGVYTPGMFVDGLEWTKWRRAKDNKFNYLAKQNAVGELTVRYSSENSTVHFSPASKDLKPSKAYIALLGAGIKAPIASGENKGKTLSHDFVVLDLQQASLNRNSEGHYYAELPKFQTNHQAPQYAIAVWVSDKSDRAPIQAAGSWLKQLK